ncbi:MAG: hypothetical protein F9K25_10740 [Candidatus Contendobacter sp.]|nr:MAG: hypothetical protein F9K25_10740 [Candidatus Contendobacter sp.]
MTLAPLALPARSTEDQSRPGLALGLRVDGQLIRFLNIHLKSACVSPLESPDPYQPGTRSSNLWCEVNDGAPASSTLTLLPSRCPGGGGALCEADGDFSRRRRSSSGSERSECSDAGGFVTAPRRNESRGAVVFAWTFQ